MTTSTVFGLPYLASQQATPEITHNEALYMIEAMLRGVKAQQNAPPGAPADGDTYLVGTAGSGAWLNKNNCVAIYMSNAWRFVPGFDTLGAQIAMGAAQEGMRIYNQATDGVLTWTGAAWSTASPLSDNTVTLAKLVNAAAQGDFIGRSTAGAGAWEDITSAQAKTRLAITGADVANTPAGGIAAATVQTAINELDTEKYTPAANTLPIADLVNAGAQFNIVGRKTAAGGAWEDCTRSQLELAVTNSSGNTYAGPQVFNGIVGYGAASGRHVELTQNDANTTFGATPNQFVLNLRNSNVTTNNWIGIGFNGGAGFPNPLSFMAQFTTYVAGAATVAEFVLFTGSTEIMRYSAARGMEMFGNAVIDQNRLFRTRSYTVATLPAAAAIPGALARVSDGSAAPVYDAIAAGGGTRQANVFSDGANWRYC